MKKHFDVHILMLKKIIVSEEIKEQTNCSRRKDIFEDLEKYTSLTAELRCINMLSIFSMCYNIFFIDWLIKKCKQRTLDTIGYNKLLIKLIIKLSIGLKSRMIHAGGFKISMEP